MRLTYYGHASFLVEAGDGTRIILDPYRSGAYDGALKHAPIDETADVVLASHDHDDHGATDTIPGNPQVFVFPTAATIGAVKIEGIPVKHDEAGGSKRGKNTIMVIDDGDVRLVHLGDLGHLLDKSTADKVGRVDVLMIPVGGYFTIDAKEAAEVVESLSPRVVIPIHYKTDKVDFPIGPVEGFLKTQGNVQRLNSSTFEVSQQTLPETRTTVVLEACR
jgi:L-ascorbate metabolism protein UlaG (beta-lactamase superfamily)